MGNSMQLVYDYDAMTNDEATAILREFMDSRPSVLKIITDEVADKTRDPRDIRYNVCHVVTSVELDTKRRAVAYSAEGDWTVGAPVAVLKRLLQPALEGI